MAYKYKIYKIPNTSWALVFCIDKGMCVQFQKLLA